MTLHWDSQRGDDWWCGDAMGTLNNDMFTIVDLGRNCLRERALDLIRAATTQFGGPPWVHFSDRTHIADDLLDNGNVTSMKSLGAHMIRLEIVS